MVKVQIRDANDHSRVFVDSITLSFDPRLSPYLRLRDGRYDAKHRMFQVVPDDSVSDIVEGDPSHSTVVIYVNEIRR